MRHLKWIANIDNDLLLIENDSVVNWYNEQTGNVEELKPEYHNNRTCFRIPRTTKRIGKSTIRKNSEIFKEPRNINKK